MWITSIFLRSIYFCVKVSTDIYLYVCVSLIISGKKPCINDDAA